MARNSNTAEAATTTSTTSKRKFGVSTANVPTAAPTIPDGIYKGNLKAVKADAADKQMAKWQEVEDLQLFDVIEVITGRKDARVKTGTYTIVGALTYAVELPNVPGEQDLPMDTMTIFNGRCNIHFSQDDEGNWNLDPSVNDFGVVNRTWKSLQKAVGLTDDDINEILGATPFDEDAEITVPERLENCPNAHDMLQACSFYKSFFSLVAERMNGVEVKVNIARRNRGDDGDMVNEINTGNFNSSCGILPA